MLCSDRITIGIYLLSHPSLRAKYCFESVGRPHVSKSPTSFATKAEAIAAIDAVRRAVSRAGTCDLVGAQLDGKD